MVPVDTRVPIIPAIVGYAGLIPFVVFAVGIWLVPTSQTEIFNRALSTYAACILAFMGAIHWGVAMNANANYQQLSLSILPALLACLALNIPFPWGYFMLIISFILLSVADIIATHHNLLPVWYPRLRIPLTLGVVLSLIGGVSGLFWSSHPA